MSEISRKVGKPGGRMCSCVSDGGYNNVVSSFPFIFFVKCLSETYKI